MIGYDSTVLSPQVTVIPQHHVLGHEVSRNVDFRPQSLRYKRTGQPQADPGFIDKILSLCQVLACRDLSPSSSSGRMMGRTYLKESPRKLRACLFPPHTALQPLRGSPVFGVSVRYGVSIVIYKAFQNKHLPGQRQQHGKQGYQIPESVLGRGSPGLATAHPSSMKNWQGKFGGYFCGQDCFL